MLILGISCDYHDSAACLYGDQGVIAAAEEERFSRRKHDSAFPSRAIAWLLEHQRISAGDLDHVVFYEKPIRKFERILAMTVDAYPVAVAHFVPAMRSWLREKLWISSRIREIGYQGDILYGEHHLSHAASAYYASPFDSAAVLTLDGVGERATTTVGRGDGLDLRIIEEVRFPHSIGLLYSVFTAYLGLEVNEGEYKVMGLAAYGTPRYAEQIERMLELGSDGSYALKQRYFGFARSLKAWTRALEDVIGPPIAPGALDEQIDERAADVAASIQLVTERQIIRIAERARSVTGSRRLCLAGGVAQNVLANGRLLREGVFDAVYVPSAPGDSGGAIGAAAHLAHGVLRRPRPSGQTAYLGPAYGEDAVLRAVTSSGLPFRRLGGAGVVSEAARMIADGRIIGWFQGRMEFGPRALGARSILADARDPGMKAKVNARIKYREPFRPFAPALSKADVPLFFTDAFASPFMSFAAKVRSDARDLIPAVTHVDGTARLQTVDGGTNPVFSRLLDEVGLLTGQRVVLNTSFNIRGEPIVATPTDAIDCFVRTSLDALFIEEFVVLPNSSPVASPNIGAPMREAVVPIT